MRGHSHRTGGSITLAIPSHVCGAGGFPTTTHGPCCWAPGTHTGQCSPRLALSSRGGNSSPHSHPEAERRAGDRRWDCTATLAQQAASSLHQRDGAGPMPPCSQDTVQLRALAPLNTKQQEPGGCLPRPTLCHHRLSPEGLTGQLLAPGQPNPGLLLLQDSLAPSTQLQPLHPPPVALGSDHLPSQQHTLQARGVSTRPGAERFPGGIRAQMPGPESCPAQPSVSAQLRLRLLPKLPLPPCWGHHWGYGASCRWTGTRGRDHHQPLPTPPAQGKLLPGHKPSWPRKEPGGPAGLRALEWLGAISC